MARYPLNLPATLKEEAEQYAAQQGVSLNQFILWAVSEKVGLLKQELDDPRFPQISYRRGAAGTPEPVLRGSGIHVRTLATAASTWGLEPEQIAAEYDIAPAAVSEALAFYAAHRQEVDAATALQDDRTVE
jgi:uncharacterized protein (DUF433 family)